MPRDDSKPHKAQDCTRNQQYPGCAAPEGRAPPGSAAAACAAICRSLDLAAQIPECSSRSPREPDEAAAAGSAASTRTARKGRRQALCPAKVRARVPTLEHGGNSHGSNALSGNFQGALLPLCPPPDLGVSCEPLSFRIPKNLGLCGILSAVPRPEAGTRSKGDVVIPSSSLLPTSAPLPSCGPSAQPPAASVGRYPLSHASRPFRSLPV